MRYKIYLKNKELGKTNNKTKAMKIYFNELINLIKKQKYSLYVYDSKKKEKIFK